MFFYALFFLGIIIEVVLLSTLKIEISNFKLSTERYNGKIISDNYKLTISLLGLQKIKFLNLEITKDRLEKIDFKEKIEKRIKKIDYISLLTILKENNTYNIKTIKKIKKHMPNVTFINLISNIGTEDAILTSYIVAIISILLGVLLRKQIQKSNNNKFIINPIYINKNLLNIELNCIFETKLIHIIYIIYILNKKGRVSKNGRTSNRRAYDYSYE